MFILRPTRKLISTLFPYTTLFRSVRQRRATKERKGVLAVFALNGTDGLDCFPESLVPVGVTEAGLRADERRQQTVGVPVLQVTFYAFRTKLALIDGEFLPGLEADDLV